jgi:regulator of protease activity HflC (stomatin/prohibitin superfamily)
MAGQQRQESGCIPCFNCCVTVPQDKIYAVELFGSFTKVIGSGLNVVGCDVGGCCISFRSITKRVEQNDVFVETKTKDNVFVLVKVSVQQQVIPEQAESAIYKLANVGAQIDSYVSDVVRSCVPKMTLDEAFEEKDSISSAVNEALTKSMHEYGFQIIKALVTELKPSQDVMNSMNEINKQKRLRDAAMMASEAEKIRVVKKAEADCEAARLQGEGIAKQREAIVDGLKRSVTSGTDEQLSSDKVSELLLITQYFETLKEIGANSKSNSVFIPHSPADGVKDISAQIRNGIMQGGAPGQMRM